MRLAKSRPKLSKKRTERQEDWKHYSCVYETKAEEKMRESQTIYFVYIYLGDLVLLNSSGWRFRPGRILC